MNCVPARRHDVTCPPVVSVVGFSNSGKTRVASAVVQALSSQGYRVAAIKHCHEGHDLDRPGSDTSKLTEAGAVNVIASSPFRITTVEETGSDATLEELIQKVNPEVDIIVAEGFKSSSVDKVLVIGEQTAYPLADRVIAVVSDRESGVDSPVYSFQELDGLATNIRRRYLS